MSKRHYMGRESIPVTHHFTEDELKGFAQEMAHAQSEAEKLEDEKKQIADSYKRRLDVETKKVSIAASKYRSGKETVHVYCNKVADYETGEIQWTDPDTGEILQRRRMTDEERQIPLVMEHEPDDEASGDAPLAIIEPSENAAQAN